MHRKRAASKERDEVVTKRTTRSASVNRGLQGHSTASGPSTSPPTNWTSTAVKHSPTKSTSNGSSTNHRRVPGNHSSTTSVTNIRTNTTANSNSADDKQTTSSNRPPRPTTPTRIADSADKTTKKTTSVLSMTPNQRPTPTSPSRIPILTAITPRLPSRIVTSTNVNVGQFKKLEALARADIVRTSSPLPQKLSSAIIGSTPKELLNEFVNVASSSKSKSKPTPSVITKTKTTSTAAPVLIPQTKTVMANAKPWVELYGPSSTSTNFVNSKKIEDVQYWLQNEARGRARILLLTGPSGSGKTATVCTLAKENDFTVREWLNPSSLVEYRKNAEFEFIEDRENAGVERQLRMKNQNQFEMFSEFILRVSLYNTLPIKIISQVNGTNIQTPAFGSKPLILVEDLPNIFYKKPEIFQEMLRNYQKEGGCPLIFILADSSSGEFGSYKLFPPNFLTEAKIHQISFNPVAPTFMVKFLQSICDSEALDIEKEELQELALSSNGDIRWAINKLEFQTLGTDRLQFKKPGPVSLKSLRSMTLKEKIAANLAVPDGEKKDEITFLFNGIGKVLYAKRNTTKSSAAHKLKDTKIGEERMYSLIENPDEIADKVQVAPQTFFNFLHQNYISFYTKLEDIVKASEHMADAADILSQWTPEDTMGKAHNTREELGLSIAIRGLMHSNTARVQSSFRQLQKPLMNESSQHLLKNMNSVQNAFGITGPILQDFYPNVLPLYFTLKKSSFNAEQLTVIREVGTLRHLSISHRKILLKENDAVDDETNEETNVEPVTSSNGFVAIGDEPLVRAIMEPEEDFLIEDYDDEFNF